MARLRALTCVAVLLVLAGCSLGWPQYAANGRNTGSISAAAPFTPQTVSQLRQRWAVADPNVGQSVLSVTGDLVYASAPVNPGPYVFPGPPPMFVPPPNPLEALSTTDGSLRWSAGGVAITSPSGGICQILTSGTAPAVDSGRLSFLASGGGCAFGGGSVNVCSDQTLDATTGAPSAPNEGPNGCLSSDPVIAADGVVYVARVPLPFSNPPGGHVARIVGSDGFLFVPPMPTTALGTPAADATTLYTVDLSNSILYAVDRRTASVRWSAPLLISPRPEQSPPVPSVGEGRVFVSTGTALEAFDAAGHTGCNPTTTGTVCNPEWSAVSMATTRAPAVAGDRVFARSGTALSAYSADTGALRWQAPLGVADGGLTALGPPSVAGLLVFVGTQDGRLLAFDSDGDRGCAGVPATCTPLWSATLGGPTGASRPAIARGSIYISSANGLHTTIYKFSN